MLPTLFSDRPPHLYLPKMLLAMADKQRLTKFLAKKSNVDSTTLKGSRVKEKQLMFTGIESIFSCVIRLG